jgi:hypothetical protein
MSENLTDEDIDRIDKKYRLVPNLEEPDNVNAQVCIEILVGSFKGCILQYGKFKLNDDQEQSLTANFEYDIIYVPDELKDASFTDEEGEQFEDMVGDILIALLWKNYHLRQEQQTKSEYDSNRKSNTISINT